MRPSVDWMSQAQGASHHGPQETDSQSRGLPPCMNVEVSQGGKSTSQRAACADRSISKSKAGKLELVK